MLTVAANLIESRKRSWMKRLQKDKYLYVFYRAFVVGELEYGCIFKTALQDHQVEKWGTSGVTG
jgi:hypothetical protein